MSCFRAVQLNNLEDAARIYSDAMEIDPRNKGTNAKILASRAEVYAKVFIFISTNAADFVFVSSPQPIRVTDIFCITGMSTVLLTIYASATGNVPILNNTRIA
jgi:hypothetical protein